MRQRKLLHIIKNHHALITGQELAKQLQVSPRTIRSDIVTINDVIRPFKAEIFSERSKGYTFISSDSSLLQELNEFDNAFLTHEDRIRYLTLRLCLADEPLNTYDLEDEIFISHTTLEHDIHKLKRQYMFSEPYIKIDYSKDWLSIEQDEYKIRAILIDLYHKDWDYHTSGNAYYGYNFLDEDTLRYIMYEVPVHLKKYNIVLDDPTLVALNLSLTIMYQRIFDGHNLPETDNFTITNPTAFALTQELFQSLEQHFNYSFPSSERFLIYQQLSHNNIQTLEDLDAKNPLSSFDYSLIEIANAYLTKIKDTFNIDLFNDEDFYLTLLFFIRDLKSDNRYYYVEKNVDMLHELLMDEFEIAYLFQDISTRYLDRYITPHELHYLSRIISGALNFLYETHPETKLKTVICCHLNPAAHWALKRQILASFDKYLNVVTLLPVNAQHFYDFSNIDLVLTTVQKNITQEDHCDIIRINNIMTPKDFATVTSYISQKQIELLCPKSNFTLSGLLQNAYWHEGETCERSFDIIDLLAQDFLNEKIVDELQVQKLLNKERLFSSVTRRGIVFLYFPNHAEKTQLSVMMLNHKCKWNSHKIRTVILGSFKKEDTSLIFRLLHLFHSDRICNAEEMCLLKTKEELCEHFKNV